MQRIRGNCSQNSQTKFGETQLVSTVAECTDLLPLCQTHKLVRSDNDNSIDKASIKTRPIVWSVLWRADRQNQLVFTENPVSPSPYVPPHLKNVQQFLNQAIQLRCMSEISVSKFRYCCILHKSRYSKSNGSMYKPATTAPPWSTAFWPHHSKIWSPTTCCGQCEFFRLHNVFYKQWEVHLGHFLQLNSLERAALPPEVQYYVQYIDDVFIVGNSRKTLRQTFARLISASTNTQFSSIWYRKRRHATLSFTPGAATSLI